MTTNHDHIGSDSTFRDSWIAGAARAFFVSAYADHVEEGDSDDNDLTDDEREERSSLPRPRNGGDWYDYAPETLPPNAYALAGELWAMLKESNSCNVYVLAERAAEADGTDTADDSKAGVDPEKFGRDLAMQAMGTGVSWFDDHKRFDLEVPLIECGAYTFDVNAYKEHDMSKSKSDDEKNEAIARLLKAVAPGDTVYTILRHISRSGMQREISLVTFDRLTADKIIDNARPVDRGVILGMLGREALTSLDYWAVMVLGPGYRIGKHGGIVVGGAGMDMGFNLVYNLGRRLWPNGAAKPHGKRNGQPDSDGGYALKHRWL